MGNCFAFCILQQPVSSACCFAGTRFIYLTKISLLIPLILKEGVTNFHQFQPISYYDINRSTFAPNPSVCSYLTSHARHPDLSCLIQVPAEALAFTGLESGEFNKMSCLCCVCSIPDDPYLINQYLKALGSF